MSRRDPEPLRWPLVLVGLVVLAALVYVIALEPALQMRREGGPEPTEVTSEATGALGGER